MLRMLPHNSSPVAVSVEVLLMQLPVHKVSSKGSKSFNKWIEIKRLEKIFETQKLSGDVINSGPLLYKSPQSGLFEENFSIKFLLLQLI